MKSLNLEIKFTLLIYMVIHPSKHSLLFEIMIYYPKEKEKM